MEVVTHTPSQGEKSCAPKFKQVSEVSQLTSNLPFRFLTVLDLHRSFDLEFCTFFQEDFSVNDPALRSEASDADSPLGTETDPRSKKNLGVIAHPRKLFWALLYPLFAPMRFV